MYSTSDVRKAYAKSKAELVKELNAAGVTFYGMPNKDEAVSAWLELFADNRPAVEVTR